MANKICGIYKLTSPSGKVYIGESKNVKKRIESYKYLLCKKQFKVYNSLQKYGWDAHTFEIIEECEIDELKCRERYWQDYYDVMCQDKGLNLRLTECGELKGEMTEAQKRHLSEIMKGKYAGEKNPMYGIRLSGELNPNYGKVLTEEEKKKIYDYNTQKKEVYNKTTAEVYESVRAAAIAVGMNYNTLRNKLCQSSHHKAHPFLIYLEDYIKYNKKEKE